MSRSRWLDTLPFFRTRRALADAARTLHDTRQEIQRLREQLETLKERQDAEKHRRRGLETRLTRRKSGEPAQRILTPHRQVFQAAGSPDQYRFANVVSYPKSGRTWFSTLYFHYARYVFDALDVTQQSLHMPDRNLVFQQLLAEKAKGTGFPVCVFTHLGFSGLKPFECQPGPWPDKARTVLTRPTVLIARNPRDVVVSHFHHLRSVGGTIEPELSLAEFIRGQWGISRVVRFMNLWADALGNDHPNLLLCTYESLKRDTTGAFTRSMAFLGASVDPHSVSKAVEESSFDRLKDRERSNRAYQGVSLEPDAFRLRRGVVGGYASELAEEDRAYLDLIVTKELDQVFTAYHQPKLDQDQGSGMGRG